MNTPHLPKLPSVQELLDHPRVKGVVQRINRSTLAQRAGAFLDDVRDSVAKRADRWDLPSVGQIAERFARRVFGEPAGDGAWINATGVVVGATELTPPLPEAALHAMVQQWGDFTSNEAAARAAAVDAVRDLHPGYDAAVFTTVDAALTLTLMSLAAGQRVGVLPAPAGATGLYDWPQLGARTGAILSEIDPAVPGDWAAVIRPPETGISGEASQHWQATDGVNQIDVAPLAGTLDPAELGLPSVATIGARLAAGARVVIVDGAGLLAGPPCGIVVGDADCIAALRNHSLAQAVAASGLQCAALRWSLVETNRTGAEAMTLALPAWQLLAAPLENLRQRAERLAQLMAEASVIAEAAAAETEGAWGVSGGRSLTAPTWAVLLTPQQGAAPALCDALARAAHPVAVRIDQDRVVVDLRSVFPRWDQELVAAVESVG